MHPSVLGSGYPFWFWLIVLMTIGWIATTWIRAKHGYPVEDSMGGKTHHPGPEKQLKQALAERDRRIEELEERVRVLERIVTDNHRTMDLREEIDGLARAR